MMNDNIPRIRFGTEKMGTIKLLDLLDPINSHQSNAEKNNEGTAYLVDREIVSHNQLIGKETLAKCNIDKHIKSLKKGDIIFTLSGSNDSNIATVAIVNCSVENLYVGDFLAAFRPKISVDNSFLINVINGLPEVRFQFARNAQKGTGIANIRRADILKVSIPMTSLEDQKKIGNILSLFDQTIKQRENYDSELKEFKRKNMDDMFV